MIIGIDPNATIDYVSKFDTTEPKTIWKLRCMTVKEVSRVAPLLVDKTKPMEGLREVVRIGLVGCANFMGKTVDKIDENLLDQIPYPLIEELSNKITLISKLTEQEIKN